MYRINHCLILWTAILVAASVEYVLGQAADNLVVLDVDQAVELALRLNPNLKIARDKENMADAQIRETAADALPHLSLNSTYTRNVKRPAFFFKIGERVQKIEIGENNSYIGNFQLEQTIFQNGQFGVRKARRIANLFSETAREGTKLTKDEVILNVRRTFYTVLLSQQVLEVFRETLSQTEAHFENVKKKYEEGVAAEFDLLRSEVDRSEAKAGFIEAQNNLELAKSALKNAIGLPLDKELNVSGALQYQPVPEQDIVRRSRKALSLRPEMKQLNLQLEMARLNIAIQKGQYLPSLSLVSNYQFQGQSSDFQFGPTERSTSFTTGLNLRFDIFTGFATSARIQKAEAETNQLQHQMETIGQLIELEIEQATRRMKDAQERIVARQKSVEQAQKAYDIAEVRYDSGIGTQLELFDARLALNRTRTNYLQAIYDYNIALFEWQKAVGIIQ
ncbi:MAG: TolC family protein [bacterium]